MKLTLVIGNKNYSSWSLRPWLLLKQAGIPFSELRIPLYTTESKARILEYSPTGKVPVLIDGDVRVWESLAICEYLAEISPQSRLWPADRAARATGRSISTEMHAGFGDLRKHMSMNCRKSLPGKGRTPEVERDISRIVAIWETCRNQFAGEGPFLFGHFTVADAMYAPVALRFAIYDVELPPVAAAYAETLRALPAMQEWLAAAQMETETIPQFENHD
jgi:glutathione S-transferase